MPLNEKILVLLAVLVVGLALVASITLFYQSESTVSAPAPVQVAGGWCPGGCTNALPTVVPIWAGVPEWVIPTPKAER